MKRSVNDYDKTPSGGYQVARTKSKNPDREAMETLGIGFGAPLAVAGVGAAMTKRSKDAEDAGQAKRELDAEMKRETRGVKKPANFDAIEEAKQDAKDAAARKKISDMGYAKGGKVKMASGGYTRSADGIAQRGKTRGKMC
jgi:hypothetical protein